MIVAGDEVHVIDAHPVESLVDSTGAGDLYAAGFLVGLSRGLDLAACGRLGSLAAAEVISHIGARPATPLAELAAAALGQLPLLTSPDVGTRVGHAFASLNSFRPREAAPWPT